MLVGDVLVVAPAAMTKIGADRVNPLSRANDHLPQLRPIEAFPALNDFGLDLLSVNRERYENDFCVEATDAGSAECDVVNVQSDPWT